MRRLGLIGILCSLLLLTACSGDPDENLTRQESYVFGTRVEIAIAGVDQARAKTMIAAAFKDLDRLHNKLHPWQAGSELVRLNRALAAGQAATMDAEIVGLLRLAQTTARQSDQLFNPALGQLVALWGFHSDTFAPIQADPTEIAAWLAHRPTADDLSLPEQAAGAVSSRNPAVAIDLGGLAKGWALDRISAQLRAQGVRHALINIGGNVLALGDKNGQPWRIGLQHPRQAGALLSLELKDGEAIGTSGDYQRYFELNGQRHCHLIDPRNGRSDCILQAVTVLVSGKQAGLRSDVASKPIYFAGIQKAAHYAKVFDLEGVLLIDQRGQVYVDSTFRARAHWIQPPSALFSLPTEPTAKTTP